VKTAVRILAVAIIGTFTLGPGGALPLRAAEMCPMGGTMVEVQTDRDKVLSWAGGQARAEINEAGTDEWSVLAFSASDQGIAIYITPGKVFFGVAGRGGETYPRDIERAFGAGFAKLKDAMGKTLADLVAAGAVKLAATDIQAIAGAAGLGVLEKGAGGWALTKQDCQAVDLPASGL